MRFPLSRRIGLFLVRLYSIDTLSTIHSSYFTRPTLTHPLQPLWHHYRGYRGDGNEKLIKRVKKLEERARKKRFSEKHSVIGARKLCSQPFNLTYQSKRSGKRMWCLSEKRSLRIQFINFLKNLFYEARLVRKKWAMGDFSTPYPLGLYPPCVPKLAEPLNMWG